MSGRSYLGEFELMILLAVIRLGDGAYGVPISKELLDLTGRDVALGSVYAALDRLEQKELGRVHTNRKASTMSAKQRNARKTTSSFSKREKMRRKPLSLR